MKQRNFCVWLMISVVLFAAVSLGGCGGSSSNLAAEDTQEEVEVSMSDVWQDEAAKEEIFSQLTSGDLLKMLFLKMVDINKKDDGSVTMKYYNVAGAVANDEDNPEITYNAADLTAYYESGDVIVIENADMNLVNTVRADLGLAEENSGKFGESGSLEIYALSCKKVDGLRNLFVYVIPRMGDFIGSDDVQTVTQDTEAESSSEDLLTSQDTAPEKNEVLQQERTLRDFQIERWVNFIRWIGDMGIMAFRNAEFASEFAVRAAANDDLASIADAQTETFDFSYSNQNYTFSGLFSNRYSYTFSRSRNNFVSVTIYSAHSFSSGKDYYVVQSNTTTVPKNFRDTYIEWNDYKRNVLYGYTKTATTEHNIDGGTMSTGDAALIRHTPVNINEQKSYSEGMSWGINGKVGVNKDGASAEIGGSVTFSKNVSWSVSEYKLINDSMKDHPASAKWYVDVQNPSNGDKHYVGAPFIYYRGVNATPASRNQIQYDSYFMWEVSKNYWQNHSNVKMYVNFSVADGFCMGWCNQGFREYDRRDWSAVKSSTQSVTLQQPSHTGVSKKSFAFTAGGAASQSFEVFSEADWTIKDIPSWLHFSDTSGAATGGNGKLILFDVDANTTGSPRSATIKISSGRDNVEVQIAQTRTN